MQLRFPWTKAAAVTEQEPKVKDFSYWADRYLSRKKRGASSTYKQSYFIIETHLRKAFGKNLLEDLTSDDVEAYLDRKVDVDKLKVADHIKHLRAIIKLARAKGVVTKELEFKNPDPTTFVGKSYTRSELARLMWHSRTNKNLRFQIYLSYQHGLRRSECVHLHFNELDLEQGVTVLPPEKLKTKHTINRRFHLSHAAKRILRARYVRYGHSTGHVFVGKGVGHQIDNCGSWKRLRVRAGVQGRFHDLRHTCVSRMVENNVPITFIQQMLGLGPDMVKRYSHVPEHISRGAVNDKTERKDTKKPWLVLMKKESHG